MKKLEYNSYTVVSQLYQLIKRDGYKSKQKFGHNCTSIMCEHEMLNLSNVDVVETSQMNLVYYDVEKQLNDARSNDDFMNSCLSAIGMRVDGKWYLSENIMNYKFGFLAVLVNNYIKKENAPESPDVSHLGWIGNEGKRGKFFVKLTELIIKNDPNNPENNYVIHKVVDKKGNRGLFYNYKMREWKNNADDDTVDYKEGIDKNDCFLMTATPARHQINKYDGGKETYFNRITIEENKGSV